MPEDTNRASETLVSEYYGSWNVIGAIEGALRAAGIDPAQVTVEELAPIDNFHSFGPAATLELAQLLGVTAEQRVLDVGGGIGGPARMIAKRFGCAVTVLDLTEAFCRAGEVLSDWTKLRDRVTFTHGSALAAPFADGSFDVAWTLHAAMNIEDKARLYAEVHRVLRPGGRFGIFDIFAGPNQPLYFPVPWASEARFSFLATPEEARAQVREAGFAERVWRAADEIEARHAQPVATAGPLTDLARFSLLPADDGARMVNIARNTAEGRMTIGMGVFERL